MYSCVTSSRYQSSTSPSGDMSSGEVTYRLMASYGSAVAEPLALSVMSVRAISVRSLGAQPTAGKRRA